MLSQALIDACIRTNPALPAIKKLVAEGHNVKELDARKRTLLHILMQADPPWGIKPSAIPSDILDVLDYLISQGIDVNVVDNEGKTAVHHVVNNGGNHWQAHDVKHDIVLRKLIDKGAKLHTLDNSKRTPLSYLASNHFPDPDGGTKEMKALFAIFRPYIGLSIPDESLPPLHAFISNRWGGENWRKEIVTFFLDNGADPRKPTTRASDFNREQATALHYAVTENFGFAIDSILKKYPDLIEAKDIQGETPIFYARSSESMRQLLAAGANIQVIAGASRQNILMRRVRYIFKAADVEIFKELLAKGVNPYHVDNQKRNLLHYISGFERWALPGRESEHEAKKEILTILLSLPGLDVNARDENGDTPLHHNRSGWKMTNYPLLAAGADPNIRNNLNLTPIYDAVRNIDIDAARELIQFGAEVEPYKATLKKLVKGFTWEEEFNALLDNHAAIHAAYQPTPESIFLQAVTNKRLDHIRTWLARNVSIHATNSRGDSALHLATVKGTDLAKDEEIIRLLLSKGGNVTLKNQAGITPIEAAILNGYDKAVILLLQHLEQHAPSSTPLKTYLHLAVKAGHISLIKLFLERGISPNEKDAEGKTAIDIAIGEKNDEALELLMKHLEQNRADPVITAELNQKGYLHAAIKSGQVSLVKKLLEQGFDPNAKDAEGNRALSIAVGLSLSEIVGMLVDYDADPIMQDSQGATAFHKIQDNDQKPRILASLKLANSRGLIIDANKGNTALLTQRLAHEVDINMRDNMDVAIGNTALEHACAMGHADIVTLLLDKGADIHVNNDAPLQQAAIANSLPIVTLLLKRGASPYVKQSAAFFLAAREGNTEIVQYLIANNGVRLLSHGDAAADIAEERGHHAIAHTIRQSIRKEQEKQDARVTALEETVAAQAKQIEALQQSIKQLTERTPPAPTGIHTARLASNRHSL